MDDDIGNFLRAKVDRMLEIAATLKSDDPFESGGPIEALVKLAADLLDKANSLDCPTAAPAPSPTQKPYLN
ncbi:MAG: hypothetical protein WDO24_07150 [Pseudomonadota bacterium]